MEFIHSNDLSSWPGLIKNDIRFLNVETKIECLSNKAFEELNQLLQIKYGTDKIKWQTVIENNKVEWVVDDFFSCLNRDLASPIPFDDLVSDDVLKSRFQQLPLAFKSELNRFSSRIENFSDDEFNSFLRRLASKIHHLASKTLDRDALIKISWIDHFNPKEPSHISAVTKLLDQQHCGICQKKFQRMKEFGTIGTVDDTVI